VWLHKDKDDQRAGRGADAGPDPRLSWSPVSYRRRQPAGQAEPRRGRWALTRVWMQQHGIALFR
jgi:hypothetical protein